MIDEKDRENAKRFLEAILFALWKEQVREANRRSHDNRLMLVGVLGGLVLAGLVFLIRFNIELHGR